MPDGGLYYTSNMELYQTGELRGLSPSGGSSAANSLSIVQSCARRARCGVQGYCPCPRGLSPSGGKTPAKLHVSLRPAPKGRGVGCRAARGSAHPVDATAVGG